MSCSSRSTVASDALDKLLITPEDLSEGWKVAGSPHNFGENYGQKDDIFVQFENRDHIAWQLILVYDDQATASEVFDRLQPVFFHDTNQSITTLFTPGEIDLSSIKAQKFILKCNRTTLSPNEICTSMAVYGDKIVLFNTHYTAQVMTANDLERILELIEEKMQN